MKYLNLLEIQKNIEEKRIILGQKLENFLLRKIGSIANYFEQVFRAKNFALIASILVILISVFVRSTRDIGHDSALNLEIAKKILEGEKYFDDFFSNNSPLFFLITQIPIFITEFLGEFFRFNQIIIADFYISFLGILSIYFSTKILSRSDISEDRTVFNLIILAFSSGFFLRIFSLQFNEFITVTSYFLTLFFPYLSYQLLKEEQLKKTDQIFLAVLQALIFCLKPHYGILIIAFEIKKIYQKKSNKKFFAEFFILRNCLTFFIIICYVVFLTIFFSDYVNHSSSLISFYLNRQYSSLFFPLKEDIFPLIILISLTFFLIKKSAFLEPFFFSALIFSLILILQLDGIYDQRAALYSVSLPLIFLVIMNLLRDKQIMWRHHLLLLLIILIIPQFDQSFFVKTAFNICAFWWVFVLALFSKWNKILSAEYVKKCNFLRYVFLPNNFFSWFCFIILTLITIYYSANNPNNNFAWSFSAVIFILLINFYDNLWRKFFNNKKLSSLSSALIFLVLSYFLNLQSAAIFKTNEEKSPNFLTNQIGKVVKNNLNMQENFIMISPRSLSAYPLRNYLEKSNPLPISQMQNFYLIIANQKKFNQIDDYLFSRLKQQLLQPENKLIFIEEKPFFTFDRCVVSFLEYYLRDDEFQKVFFRNYTFFDRIIITKTAEKKVKFFNDKITNEATLEAGDLVFQDVEIYIRKNAQ
ncbi:MAG: hypothetical protein SFV53_05965 [Rickettsiales bacterium]|nr:hypothetical protein [Rickettsiales bacterium]